jgi:hypothetical protein
MYCYSGIISTAREMSSAIKLGHNTNRQRTRYKTFVICDTCFWCASFLVKDHDSACPECGKPVSATTLGQNEGYLYDYSDQRGIELDFYIIKASRHA